MSLGGDGLTHELRDQAEAVLFAQSAASRAADALRAASTTTTTSTATTTTTSMTAVRTPTTVVGAARGNRVIRGRHSLVEVAVRARFVFFLL